MKARCWSSRPAFSSRARHPAEWRDSTLVPSGRSRIVRSGVCGLCVALRPCLHGPRTLSAEELDGRPASPERGACARRCRLFNEAATCREDDCARHCGASPACLGCGAIEGSFETAKNEFGLDHNETRSWHGWHRHVSLVMLTFAMMAAIRRKANVPAKNTSRAARMRKTSSVGQSRKSAE